MFQVSGPPSGAGPIRERNFGCFQLPQYLPAIPTEPRATVRVCQMKPSSEEKADSSTISNR